VIEMGEETRRLDLRPLLAVAAVVVLAALTMWATGAFAAGSSPPSSDVPAAAVDSPFVQDGDRGQTPSREDCPKDGGGGGTASEGSDGSGSPDL
jgi:hypothetical protein